MLLCIVEEPEKWLRARWNHASSGPPVSRRFIATHQNNVSVLYDLCPELLDFSRALRFNYSQSQEHKPKIKW